MTQQEQLQLKVIACQTLGPGATQAQVEERFSWLAYDAIARAYVEGRNVTKAAIISELAEAPKVTAE